MHRQKHYYGLNHFHFLARSTYRRARLFDSERFKRRWVRTLKELRHEPNFEIVGYVHGSNSVIAYMPKCGTYAPPALDKERVRRCPIQIDYVRLPEGYRG